MLQKANTPDKEITTTETMASLSKPVEVSTVYNQRKATTVLPPIIPHPAYEPWPAVLIAKVTTTKNKKMISQSQILFILERYLTWLIEQR
jgi:hypothetical protein